VIDASLCSVAMVIASPTHFLLDSMVPIRKEGRKERGVDLAPFSPACRFPLSLALRQALLAFIGWGGMPEEADVGGIKAGAALLRAVVALDVQIEPAVLDKVRWCLLFSNLC